MKKTFRPKGTLLAALDIGSSKTACFIGRPEGDAGSFTVLGAGKKLSRGIKNGTITDLEAAEACIRGCVEEAENMAAEHLKGYPLREVVVSLPGVHALSHPHTAEIQMAGHEITDSDIRRALARAQESVVSENAELVHTIPVDYRIDGHEGIREPRGMVGQNLSIDIHLVTGDAPALRNMAECIQRSHLDITSFCLGSYAAGLATLVDDEMDLGCTVIDIGAGVTSFAVFQGGAMIFADALPIGGAHVTSDIARGLTTSIEDAERIKRLYGSAVANNLDQNELIDVPLLGEDEQRKPNHIPRSLLVGIMQPRLEEIFELVRARLADSGLGAGLGRRVVLTGGSSQIAGLRDLAQHVLDKQVRLGRPIRLSGLPDSCDGPDFATTAGLLTYVSERYEEMPAVIVHSAGGGSMWERVRRWLRENW